VLDDPVVHVFEPRVVDVENFAGSSKVVVVYAALPPWDV